VLRIQTYIVYYYIIVSLPAVHPPPPATRFDKSKPDFSEECALFCTYTHARTTIETPLRHLCPRWNAQAGNGSIPGNAARDEDTVFIIYYYNRASVYRSPAATMIRAIFFHAHTPAKITSVYYQ